MARNLQLVRNNPDPDRERRYPSTWLLHTPGQDAVEVRVERDSVRRPRVVGRSAA
ncbi:MAG TPA: hypothetical protein VFA89_14755 [Terriglobales bacterium]|nr:hypothetical protein [Terriglobales bacterium]